MITPAQMRSALSEAMERRVAFSWIKKQTVQKGVYLTYTQAHYAAYIAK